ncbi:MAG: ADP-heptose--LPS heptosyltransferase [Steroidobacteraceae bacterium]
MGKISPQQIETQWLRHMRRGEWEAAWQISDLELRRRRATDQIGVPGEPRHCQTIWNGMPLRGRRVLVRCYHGLGDTVQFIRFVPLLRQIAKTTLVWAQPQLLPLLRTAAGIDVLLPLHDGEPQADFDADIELMELPHALRVTLDTLPCDVPYFDLGRRPPPPRADTVGIVWQSGAWDSRRSIAPSLLTALTQVEGIRWQILQRGPALALRPPGLGQVPEIHGILDEAVHMRSLDLLISVDTLSAHLGGALGVPTWTLLPTDADWRWMENRDDTPWYPTMRLFRQDEPGNWRPVIQRVVAALQARRQRRLSPSDAMAV